MADDPSNTKPELCSLDAAVWVSATKLGENIAQINHWVVARLDIQEALAGGCDAALELELNGQKSYVIPPPGFWLPPDRLRWVNGLNPSMRREDYPDRPWPWELRAYLSPSEPWEFRHLDGSPIAREQVSTTLPVFLRRAEAAQWGLLPALESPQAVAIEERPPPPKQPGVPTVGSTGGETAPAPASVADAPAPVANTEAPVAEPEVASSPLVDAMTAKTATPPEPATLIDAANDKPSEPNSDRQSEQSGNPVWDWSTLVQHLEAKKLTFNTEQDALSITGVMFDGLMK